MGVTIPVSAPSRGYYRPELDLLRLLAFFMVFLSHVVPGDKAFFTHMPRLLAPVIIAACAGGAWGVDLFFALSSFLITTLLLSERAERGTIDVRSFYIRRILRIWPLYFVFLFCITPFVHAFLPGEDLAAKYVLAFALLAGNWACAAWGFPHSVAGPLWSVSIEEQFYLAWPWVLRRWADHLGIVAAILVAAAFLTRIGLAAAGAIHPQIWCNTLAHLDSIGCGAWVAAYVQRHQPVLARNRRILLAAGGFMLLVAIGRYGNFVGSRGVITFPVATAACIALLIATLGAPMLTMRNAFMSALTYLGRISYGMYVFHFTFIQVLGITHESNPGLRLVRSAAALVATIGVAACSYEFLEQPFLRMKENFAYVQSARA